MRTKRKRYVAVRYSCFTNQLAFLLGIFFLLIFRTMGAVVPLNSDTSYHTTRQPFIMSLRVHLDRYCQQRVVPREDLTYTTLTLSNQDVIFRYGLYVISAPTQPVFASDTSPTGYFPVGPEADATTGRTQPLLQHLDPHGRGQPSYGHL